MPFDPQRLKSFPSAPGVYRMKSAEGEVLYVGKAKDLRVRVRQYFQGSDERVQIPYLLQHVEEIECTITRSEKEALILEQALIQRHKPRYNILLKDDRSPLRIVITDHPVPRLELARSKSAVEHVYFQSTGFASPILAREMFDLTAKVFRLRQCSDAEFKRRTRPCLLYAMKLCSAPCVDLISPKAYSDDVRKAVKALKGDVQTLLQETKQVMQEKSDALEFEQALVLRKRKETLEAFIDRCSVETVKGVESCDVVGFWAEGRSFAFSTLRYRDGKLQESGSTIIADSWSTPQEALAEFLMQLFCRPADVLGWPEELLLPFESEELHLFEEYIRDERRISVQVKVPIQGSKRTLVRIANENAKSRLSLSTNVDERRRHLLYDIQEVLHLRQPPSRIDCFDSSHLGGSDAVACCVGFIEGEPSKQRYRTLSISQAKGGDDCGMLKEAIFRRYKNIEESDLPDLILIDGGKGQLKAALEGVQGTPASDCDIISLSKEEGRHDKGIRAELLYCSSQSAEIRLEPTHPVLLFLQSVRDEAHRFSLSFQKKKRSQRLVLSQLDDIPGIGPARKRLLLKKFGSVQALCRASIEEVVEKTGLAEKLVEQLLIFLKNTSP